jgi:hypothetical protein
VIDNHSLEEDKDAAAMLAAGDEDPEYQLD